MPIHLLLIDDDEDDQIFFKDSLQHIGVSAQVQGAFSGPEALKLLEEMKDNLPNLIILDLNMPLMHGIEVLKRIKAKYDIPVLIHTTTCSNDVILKTKEVGAVDCLLKGTSFSDSLKFAKRTWEVLKISNSLVL